MSLVVGTGAGEAAAESPNSVAEIDTYFANRGNVQWAGTAAEKEAYARQGSDWLEGVYGLRLSGDRQVAGQALSFPRIDAEYLDGRTIAISTVVKEWKFAHCEASLLAKLGTLSKVYKRGGRIKRVAVEGAIEEEFFDDAPATPLFEDVEKHLAMLVLPLRPRMKFSKPSPPDLIGYRQYR